MSDNSFQFELSDEDTGLRALFIATRAEPGEVAVAIYDDSSEKFRTPSDDELEAIEVHPLSARIRIDLVMESGKAWAEWRPFAELLLNLASSSLRAQS